MAEIETTEEANEAEKQTTRQEFAEYIASGSLYQKYRFTALPPRFSDVRPVGLWLYCGTCKRETTFRDRPDFARNSRLQPEADVGQSYPRGSAHNESIESRVYVVAWQCMACLREEFICWIEIDKENGYARKVGQLPEPSIRPSREVEDALGRDIELYKRAKICLTHSYGIAACAYLRRILENRITPLLESIRMTRQEDGAEAGELARIDSIIAGKIADQKIALVGDVLPDSLTVEGDNPIHLMWNELSFGIHSGNEDQCVEIATRTVPNLEYVFVELAADQRRRQAGKGFRESIRELRRQRTERERAS